MKYVGNMNELVADLAVFNVKLHNIHWNVVGQQFVAIHTFTEGLYNEAFEAFDAVAEAIKMAGIYPAASMKEYLELTNIKELGHNSYKTNEALELVLNDLEYLNKKALIIRDEADKEDDYEVVALMECLVSKNKKHIWFIESMLK